MFAVLFLFCFFLFFLGGKKRGGGGNDGLLFSYILLQFSNAKTWWRVKEGKSGGSGSDVVNVIKNERTRACVGYRDKKKTSMSFRELKRDSQFPLVCRREN